MYILGINSAYHESAACLIEDGNIICACEEERFNRIKHGKIFSANSTNNLPQQSISNCLEKASRKAGKSISIKEIDYIGYSLNPTRRKYKNLEYTSSIRPKPYYPGSKEGEDLFYNKSMLIGPELRKQGFEGKLIFINHHDCHAASAYNVSPFNESAIIVIDGIGEFESTSIYYGKDNKVKKMLEIDFPNSLGFLWEKMSLFLGFKRGEACKVMGLAAYSTPDKYINIFKSLLDINENTFEINDNILQIRTTNFTELENLFKIKRRVTPINKISQTPIEYIKIASALQEQTEKAILALCKKSKELTKSNNLCLAGGVSLNCLANAKILKSNLFKNTFIQPAAHDAGTSLGACYYIWNQLLSNKKRPPMKNAYLGPSYSNKEILKILKKGNYNYKYYEDIDDITAKHLHQQKVVSFFQSKMEFGPRALGNRSILFDPSSKHARDHLNNVIKYREEFRPFCPSILKEHAEEYFDINSLSLYPTEYMLAAIDMNENYTKTFKSVIHEDTSSRVQLVDKKNNSRYYKLLKCFFEKSGIPMLLNTSYNVQEPIVCTPSDALATYSKSKIDYMAIGNYLVSR